MSSTYRFVVNLRTDTTTADFVQRLRPPGWLAAPENTTAATRRFAAESTRRGRQFFADNGNYGRIGDLLVQHAGPAAALRARVTAIEAALDRTALRADLPADLQAAYDDLLSTLVTSAEALVPAPEQLLAEQEPLGANRLIGVEDITGASLLALDGEPHLVGWDRRAWRRRNRAVAQRARDILGARPELGASYHPVATALDWAAAHDAGREFAAAGLTRAAMGFGAYMADDHYVDFVRIGNRTRRLPRRYPQRYLRTAVVAKGFFDGFRAEAGRELDSFHFLGLGAPVMMAVVAVAADGTRQVTFDAMSPIKDAVEGTLYVSKPALLKIRTRKVAERMSARGGAWGCPCPFCRGFAAAHPWDLAAARAWGASRSVPTVGAEDLRPGGGLYAALPLLGEPSGGAMRAAVNAARMGHNHWVLHGLCRRLSRSPDVMASVGALVDQYARATTSTVFADAVRLGFELVQDR